jgi:phosphohistidine phosphatase
MKRLILIRHAKSSWSSEEEDYYRPLNKRGLHDAPLMGDILKLKNIYPDIIISSSAKRAAKTSKIIADQLEFNREKIEFTESLYGATINDLNQIISNIDESINTVFIITHNPLITDFSNSINDGFKVENVPTCGIVGINFIGKWQEFDKKTKNVFLFDFPKNYYKKEKKAKENFSL